MPDAPNEIAIRLAYWGPPGTGKTASIEKFAERLKQELPEGSSRAPVISFNAIDGSTLLYDYLAFDMALAAAQLHIELFALPGAPRHELARRMLLSGIDGIILCVDARDEKLDESLAGLRRLEEALKGCGRSLDSAVVAQLNKSDLVHGADGSRAFGALKGQLGEKRVTRASARTGDGIVTAVKMCAALALAREKEAIEARKKGAPPPKVDVPPDLDEDTALAYKLYLRSFVGRDALGSPHSELFFGRVLLELGAVGEPELEEALRLRAQAIDLAIGVSLEEVLKNKDMVDTERLARAHRVRSCAEAIHEEILYGKLASEHDVVPFVRVKRALVVQSRRGFMHSLGHLLMRAGHLQREGHVRVLMQLLQVHQGELLREKRQMKAAAKPRETARRVGDTRKQRPLFGTIALRHGFVTEEQLDECVKEQRALQEKGERWFLGALLQRKSYLGADEVAIICKALEDEIANDHIEGYQIVAPLGRGAMALVFAAKQKNLDRVVALKVLDPKLSFDNEFIDRFVTEARAAARLNHPNIVQAYDVGTGNGYHYFAMEYVEGVTLRELVDDRQGRLEENLAVFIVREIARALQHAEAHGLVHRDIKPGNIMISRSGVVKLCDLGLAQRVDAAKEGQKEDGVIMGSPYYISPEQIEGRPDLDSRADIYSLGATLFHILTGRPPYLGRSPEEVCLKHLSEPVPDPRELNDTITQRLLPVLFRMMHKDREQRHPNCAELVADLNRLLPSTQSEDARQEELSQRVKERFPKART
ncbi:protein kinase [bacterium]|nr:protein kinase [bacterium]